MIGPRSRLFPAFLTDCYPYLFSHLIFSFFICDALETDWLDGADGFEPLHFGISIRWCWSSRLSLVRGGMTTLLEMRMFDFSRPELRVLANSILRCSIRILPPQPASPSLTHTDAALRRWRFPHLDFSDSHEGTPEYVLPPPAIGAGYRRPFRHTPCTSVLMLTDDSMCFGVE